MNTERDGWRDVNELDATDDELRLVHMIFGTKPKSMTDENWRTNMRGVAGDIRRHVASQLSAANAKIKELTFGWAADREELTRKQGCETNAVINQWSSDVDRLERLVQKYRSALERIANQDYRGNKSTEQQIAEEALRNDP